MSTCVQFVNRSIHKQGCRSEWIGIHIPTFAASQINRPSPHPVIQWQAFDATVKSGKLEVDGTGRKPDPFRYFLPGLDAEWTPDMTEMMSF